MRYRDINNARPEELYRYARNVIIGRFPEAESVIAKNSYWSYHYARDILKGRFLEAEPAIVEQAIRSRWYVKDTIKQNCYWIEIFQ